MADSARLDDTAPIDMPLDARRRLEARVSPAASFLVAGVALLLTAALGWMAWAEVEEVVQARGQVEPVGRVKLINHARGGKVAELAVAEGQQVHAGDVLLTFAPELAEGQRRELTATLEVREAETARVEAELEGRPLAFTPELAAARPDLLAQQMALMQARRESLEARRRSLEQAVQVRQSGGREVEADAQRLRSSLGLLRQQLAAVRELAERGLYPKLKMAEIERQVVEHEGALAKTGASLGGAEASLAERKADLARLEKDWQSQLLEEQAVATAERDRLRAELASQETVLGELEVKAPEDGIVQELRVLAPGQSVAANDMLMKLVPLSAGLVIRAEVANADIGRIKAGMDATLKVRAYDFARFGSIDGKVERIAADSSASGPDTPPAYGVTVLAAQSHVGADARNAVLPGMIVDVELKVGERSILSYLTDGITRYRQKAFKEG